jgi:lipopolysaccharide transport system permease protein
VGYWRLLLRVSLSELRSRYAGSLFGLGWAVLSPLFIISIYAVIYLVVFRVRVPSMSSFQYVLFIFSGLIPFLMTSDSLGNGVGSVVVNRAVLSNTVFPVDIVPVKSVILAQTSMVVGMVVIVSAVALTGSLSWSILLLPVLWLLHMMALVGILWFISLINLIFRDLQNMVGLVVMVLMVASPIAYTPDMVPDALKMLILLNPFAYFVIAYQQVIVLGTLPSIGNLFAVVLLGGGLFVVGGYFFYHAKQALIDYV